MCKGRACALHLTDAYMEGYEAGLVNASYKIPYDFYDQYEEHYAWDIGYQKGKKDLC